MKTKPTPRERKNVMLAAPFDEKYLSKFSTIYAQPKLNGIRCLAHCFQQDGIYSVALFSSTGIQFNFSATRQIHEDLMFFHRNLGYRRDLILDGEIYNHNLPFQEISGLARRKTSTLAASDKLQFHIFDIKENARFRHRALALDELAVRHREIKLVGHTEPLSHIAFVKTIVLSGPHIISDMLEEFLSEGYEGIILRDSQGVYEDCRSKGMLKIKPNLTDFYQISDTIQAVDKNYQFLPRLGAFVCEDPDGTSFNIGPGKLTHKELETLWTERESLPGKWVKVLYYGETKSGKPVSGRAVSVHTNPERN